MKFMPNIETTFDRMIPTMQRNADRLAEWFDRWLSGEDRTPLLIQCPPGSGKTLTTRQFWSEKEGVVVTRWSAADPTFVDKLRHYLRKPQADMYSYFEGPKRVRVLWIDDLEANVHSLKVLIPILRELAAQQARMQRPWMVTSGVLSDEFLEGLPLMQREALESPEEGTTLGRVHDVLSSPVLPSTDALLTLYHSHRIFVPLLFLENTHRAWSAQVSGKSSLCESLQTMQAMFLSDRIDTLWRTGSHDELLRFHAWLSVLLPLRLLTRQSGRNANATWTPVFTPFPGKCTARLSLRKHWLEVLKRVPNPVLRDANLWAALSQAYGQRGAKCTSSPWPRPLLTFLVGQVTPAKKPKAQVHTK